MADDVPLLDIVVACSPAPREVREWRLQLPTGATVHDAVRAAGVLQALPALAGGFTAGVWGRTALPSRVLQPDDRVEVYRPLQVDPKRARRERFQRQGVRAAGLFAQKKTGPKARS